MGSTIESGIKLNKQQVRWLKKAIKLLKEVVTLLELCLPE